MKKLLSEQARLGHSMAAKKKLASAKLGQVCGMADGGLVQQAVKGLQGRATAIETAVNGAPAPAPVAAPAPAPMAPRPQITAADAEAKAARFKWERDNPGVPYKPPVPKMADGGLLSNFFDQRPTIAADPNAAFGSAARQLAESAAYSASLTKDIAQQEANAAPNIASISSPVPAAQTSMVTADPTKPVMPSLGQPKPPVQSSQGWNYKNGRIAMKDGGRVWYPGQEIGNYAHGGRIHQGPGAVRGPGGPVDDKVPAMLSNGEYVLPADTVQAVGKQKLDALKDATHSHVSPDPLDRKPKNIVPPVQFNDTVGYFANGGLGASYINPRFGTAAQMSVPQRGDGGYPTPEIFPPGVARMAGGGDAVEAARRAAAELAAQNAAKNLPVPYQFQPNTAPPGPAPDPLGEFGPTQPRPAAPPPPPRQPFMPAGADVAAPPNTARPTGPIDPKFTPNPDGTVNPREAAFREAQMRSAADDIMKEATGNAKAGAPAAPKRPWYNPNISVQGAGNAAKGLGKATLAMAPVIGAIQTATGPAEQRTVGGFLQNTGNAATFGQAGHLGSGLGLAAEAASRGDWKDVIPSFQLGWADSKPKAAAPAPAPGAPKPPVTPMTGPDTMDTRDLRPSANEHIRNPAHLPPVTEAAVRKLGVTSDQIAQAPVTQDQRDAWQEAGGLRNVNVPGGQVNMSTPQAAIFGTAGKPGGPINNFVGTSTGMAAPEKTGVTFGITPEDLAIYKQQQAMASMVGQAPAYAAPAMSKEHVAAQNTLSELSGRLARYGQTMSRPERNGLLAAIEGAKANLLGHETSYRTATDQANQAYGGAVQAHNHRLGYAAQMQGNQLAAANNAAQIAMQGANSRNELAKAMIAANVEHYKLDNAAKQQNLERSTKSITDYAQAQGLDPEATKVFAAAMSSALEGTKFEGGKSWYDVSPEQLHTELRGRAAVAAKIAQASKNANSSVWAYLFGNAKTPGDLAESPEELKGWEGFRSAIQSGQGPFSALLQRQYGYKGGNVAIPASQLGTAAEVKYGVK